MTTPTAPPDERRAPAANRGPSESATREAAHSAARIPDSEALNPAATPDSEALNPAATPDSESLNPLRTGPYGRTALDYFAAGHRGIIPVRGKNLPVDGFTGAKGADTSYADVHAWTEDPATAARNVALRLGPDQIGLDVDAYNGRNGARTLAEVEAELGELPPTVTSTSRTDGTSGIRMFTVDGAGLLTWPPNLDGLTSQSPSHLDILRYAHRYAVCEPSVHPDTGAMYRWYGPDGQPLGRAPRPDEFAVLPDAWVQWITGGLLAGETRAAPPSTGGLLSVSEERPSKHTGPIPDGVRHATLVSYAGHMHHLGIPLKMAETLMLKRLEDCAQPPHAATPVTPAEALEKLHDIFDRYPAGRVIPEGDEPQTDVVEAEEEEDQAPRRNTPLDWTTVLDGEQPDPDWLAEPLLEAGTSVALYSPPKAGKSLLALDVCAGLAAGRPVLGNAAREPLRVLYLDAENTLADLGERLRDMAYTPGDLGDRLIYVSFPTMAPLDSSMGGLDLLTLVEDHHPDIVVLDTLSRFVEGDENEAPTYHDLYRYSLVRLKALGIAVLRLDHAGKDMTKGQRGSSAKSADVDAVWRLSPGTGGTVELVRDISRNGHGADRVSLARLSGPLRHEPVARVAGGMFSTAESPRVEGIIRALDEAGVPLTYGREQARQKLTVPVRNDTLTAALKVRRERAQEQDDDDDPFGDLGGGVG